MSERYASDFDHWRSMQTQDVLAMSVVQQAAHYARDEEWHERESDTAYLWRHAAVGEH